MSISFSYLFDTWMTRLVLYLKWQHVHSDSLHAWGASLQHSWAPTCMLCTVSLSKAAIDSQSIRSHQTGFCHEMRNREKAMVSCAFVANNNVGARFAQPTRDSRSRYGSHVGCYHRANIRAALAVLSQGASRVPRMLCPRIGVAHGHVSCGLLSRSDSSLEDAENLGERIKQNS